MEILSYFNAFPCEEQCKLHLKQVQEKWGISCKKCDCKKLYWLKSKGKWQCAECKFRQSLLSGTLFENSNIPLRKWFLAMKFLRLNGYKMKASNLQRLLNPIDYRTACLMKNKICSTMKNTDYDFYYLEDLVQVKEVLSMIGLKLGKPSTDRCWERLARI